MTDFLMPAFTDQMEEGTIVKWLVDDGQAVTAGDELAEIETDKATQACVAEEDGVVRILVPEGESAAVGAAIARIGSGAEAPVPEAEEEADTTAAAVPAEPVPAAAANGNGNGHGAAVSTPLARRVALAHDVALDSVTGTGPRGRITRGDVLQAAGVELPAPAAPVPAPAAVTREQPAAPAAAPPEGRWQEPTRLQQVVARRMSEQAAVPVFQVQTEVRMDAALALRAELKALAGERPAPSVNDLIVRASALALRDHPLVNGSYQEGRYLLHDHVSVGIAVATDAGLVVATIPETDRLSLGQLAHESRELAGRVRAGKGTAAELSGATFTVSNLGMFGMTQITAVINPPQAAILGVGAARTVLARDRGGEIVEQQLLALNLSCDHRILNGADGSRFLSDVRELLETPLKMAL